MTKQIMIVDNDRDNLELMQLLLECAGYEVQGSTTGKEIQQVCPGELPDLILLDVTQAEDEGRTLCTHLKTHEQTKAVPIILLAASVPVGQLKEDYPADDFIAKPFELDTLFPSFLDTVAFSFQRRDEELGGMMPPSSVEYLNEYTRIMHTREERSSSAPPLIM